MYQQGEVHWDWGDEEVWSLVCLWILIFLPKSCEVAYKVRTGKQREDEGRETGLCRRGMSLRDSNHPQNELSVSTGTALGR